MTCSMLSAMRLATFSVRLLGSREPPVRPVVKRSYPRSSDEMTAAASYKKYLGTFDHRRQPSDTRSPASQLPSFPFFRLPQALPSPQPSSCVPCTGISLQPPNMQLDKLALILMHSTQTPKPELQQCSSQPDALGSQHVWRVPWTTKYSRLARRKSRHDDRMLCI